MTIQIMHILGIWKFCQIVFYYNHCFFNIQFNDFVLRFLTISLLIYLVSSPQETPNRDDGIPVKGCDDILLVGLAVCWGGRDAYYFSLQKEQKHPGK